MFDLVKSTIKKSSWSYYVLILNIITGFMHTGLLTRALGPQEYGRYHVILAVGAIIMGISSFLGSEALIPYATKYKKNGDDKNLIRTIKSTISLIYLTTIIGCLFFIIIIYIKPQLAGVIGDEIILSVLIGCTGIAGANIYSYMNILRVFENYSIYLRQALIFDTFKVIIAATLYYLNFGLIYYVAGLLIRQILQALYYDYHTRKAIEKHIGSPLKTLLTNEVVINSEEKKFFTFNFFNSKLRTLSLHLDKVLINLLLNNTAAVGLYAAAKQIMQMTELAFSNLSTAIIPQIASDYFSNKKNLKKNIIIQTGIIAIIGLPVIGFVMFFVGDIIKLWMGADFLAAVPIVRIVLISVIIRVIFFVINEIPSSTGDAKVKLIGSIFGLITSLTIILTTYIHLGILSFAYGMVGGLTVSSVIMLFYSMRIINNTK